ncbi:MAG: (E)-4-hydroxy-3-methylbut-2-enyl-diphosphate synthase [Bacteroidales bacterium]|nr:(E)-4-hydroxy-3-methylbut-2-enyl-diphosphate synthase [Bacteroidales bacterium]
MKTLFNYNRRHTDKVNIGNTPLGTGYPIRIQSMTNTSTNDVDGSVAQAKRMIDAGAEYVRLTAQGVREAENLGEINRRLKADGYDVPLVADIHFNPKAAYASAVNVEKVRINPGNFVDPGRTFKKIDYTDDEYQAEIKRINEAVAPFLKLCKENGTAVRIGVNHGSLSDRIMSRYGNTPAGMAESAMEFLRVCKKEGFANVVVSMKASNTVVMTESVRRLVKAMDHEDMHYPIHLGVTEAGDGEDGRIKSAVGIGALMADGIGDTIRVSLSEAPEAELPVARELVDYITKRSESPRLEGVWFEEYDPIAPERIATEPFENLGGDNPTRVVVDKIESELYDPDRTPEVSLAGKNWTVIDCTNVPDTESLKADKSPIILTSLGIDPVGEIKRTIHSLMVAGIKRPIIISLNYDRLDDDKVALRAAADMGALLLSGVGDGIMIEADQLTPRRRADIAYGILQAARRRFTKTEYISCPGCGRTLFDLQSTVKEIKQATGHLKGLKIGVMGCIVNGPGEMADADYGYVGAASGHVSLYKGKECVEKNIPSADALPRLVELLKAEGVWTEPK